MNGNAHWCVGKVAEKQCKQGGLWTVVSKKMSPLWEAVAVIVTSFFVGRFWGMSSFKTYNTLKFLVFKI
jgi:hypothetical protein